MFALDYIFNKKIKLISINGTTHIDPKRYDEDVLEKVYEYYKYYYHKYNTNKEG